MLSVGSQLRPWLSYFPFAADIYLPVEIPRSLYPLFSFTWVAILMLLSVYDGRRNLRVVDEFTSLSLGALLAAVSMAGTLFLTYRQISRLLFLLFVGLTYFSMLGWRALARLVFSKLGGKAVQNRRVLVIGAGPVGLELLEQIKQCSYLGLVVAGFLDDNSHKRLERKDILGSLIDARNVIQGYRIDDVVIALPRSAYERVNWLVAELHDLPVKVWVIPDYFHLALHKAAFEEFAGIPMLDLRAPALTDYQRLVKRAFDLLITLLLMPLSLVVMGLIAFAIRLEGPGQVLFRQKRVGENGVVFNMYKFRTMVTEAEQLRHLVEQYDEDGNLIHKPVDDPRVTRIGRFLRRTSLDELPQLFNILKGEMSLVGPRPEMSYLVERYKPWQRKRFTVPQGITGWWQINGRSEKPMHLYTEYDIYYVQNYSLLLDIQILLKTVGVVLRRRGAF
jgi:exopolysaccharide biosynthesis polyprenyl glycosylphosphotransferase